MILVIDLYIFWVLKGTYKVKSIFWRVLLSVLFWTIPLLSVFYMVMNAYYDVKSFNKLLHTFTRTFIFIIYVGKLLMIIPFLMDDFWRWGRFLWERQFKSVKGTFQPQRKKFLINLGAILGSAPIGILTYGVIRNPYRYQLFKETVPIPNLPNDLSGLRIVQISDIHAGSFNFKDPVKNAISLINAQKPDLVFFTGDMVNDRAEEMENYMDVFNKIKAKYGVFSVLGNHDYGDYVRWPSPEDKAANLERMKEVHKELGWQLLVNENRILEIGQAKVAVLGVENYSVVRRFPRYGKLEKAYQGAAHTDLKLLLSHDPSHWDAQVVPQFKDIDITFSGHTHGMQFGVEIPGWIKWSPIKYLYTQWAGLYQKDHQYLYVNRGLGFIGYPGRVGILPEVTLLELQPA